MFVHARRVYVNAVLNNSYIKVANEATRDDLTVVTFTLFVIF